ncbi:MAG: histidine kinase [Acidimicrobiales bacterium]
MSTWRSRITALWTRIGPRARDVVFILFALAAALAETLARRHERPIVWSAVLAAGLIGTGALWWRRRYPVAVTIVAIATFAATSGAVPLVIALFSLAVRRRDRVLAVTTLAVAAAFAIKSSIGSSSSWVGFVALGLIEAGFCAAAGAYIGARRDLVSALRERALRAEEDQELRAEQAKLGERARIAREMHDVLAHKVTLIAMHAGALEVQRAPTAQQVTDAAALIRSTAREAMEELRGVLGVLRADGDSYETDLAPQPQRADIERLVDASRATGMQIDLRVELAALPDAMARTAHRVVLEGLTNVHKHARGAATCVSLTGDEQHGLTVEVVNRRPVASAALLPGSGVGLHGLRERVSLVGGTLEAGPSPDGGWRVAAWLPWLAGASA